VPQVVPSQIVEFIEDRFRDILAYTPGPNPGPREFPYFTGVVRGLVALLDRLPSELLPPRPEDFADLIVAQEALRGGIQESLRDHGVNLTRDERNGIQDLARILRTCPDAAPPAGTTDPAFIDDEELRAELHHDLGEVDRALQNGEWKATTVLAGSVIEALLLWALQSRKPSEVTEETATLKKPIEHWYLHELINLAHRTGLISQDTRVAADQGKDFRNLIHPGRAARLAAKCNRATALIGVGALAAVMVDLAK